MLKTLFFGFIALIAFAALPCASALYPIGTAEAQVITVPDPEDLPPRPRVLIPRHPDCPKGQICTTCFAGCNDGRQSAIVFEAPTPPKRTVSKDPPIPNAHLAGANRHPASTIICGKEGTCRGFGMRDEDSYWTRGWNYNDQSSYPAHYPSYHYFYFAPQFFAPYYWW